jgi:hypothetical protein
VWTDCEVVRFTTDNDINYAVDFDYDSNPYFTAYWLNLTNESGKTSPGDSKIPRTVICIIEEFFRQNPDIMLHMCSTAKRQQAQRARLFLRWFNGYEQQQRYVIKAYDVKSTDAEGKPTKDYVALIIQRTNPQLDEIVARFDSEIAMFNEFKP